MSPVRQPSGVVALARATAASLDEVIAGAPQLVVILSGIQDAGNVGAIVRAADGCGATGVVAAEGTADPFGWKALRGAMGSTFRAADRRPAADSRDAGAASRARRRRSSRRFRATARRCPAARAARTGRHPARRRRRGLFPTTRCGRRPAALDSRCAPPVESFNVAITAALILYEAAKQRDGHVAVR